MSIPKVLRTGETIDSFPAASWNALVEQYYRADPPRKPGTGAASGMRSVLYMPCQNKHTAAVNSGSILGIDDIAYQYTSSNNAELDVPVASGKPFAEGKQWGIIRDKTEVDGISSLLISGAAWCQIDVIDAADEVAGPVVDDVASLKSGSGVPILWKETGTGIKWGVVMLGASPSTKLVWAMVVGDIPAFSAIDGTAITATPGKSVSQSVNIMTWNGANLEADQDATTLLGINASGTNIRASIPEPILVLGFRENVDGDDCFTIVNVMDSRCSPNYNQTLMQIVFHKENEGGFQLDAEVCT